MSAYMVAFVTAHSLDWVPEYIAHVPAVARRYGGEFLGVAAGPHPRAPLPIHGQRQSVSRVGRLRAVSGGPDSGERE
jgi:hypothetical protein